MGNASMTRHTGATGPQFDPDAWRRLAVAQRQQPAEIVAGYAAAENAARSLASTLPSPFGTLAFMGLSVIPEARITDRGFLRLG